MDDKHIVAQARRGELSAFEELVTRYEKRVYAIALRSSGSPEDAADITQEVFLRAWRSMKDFRGDSGFATWLFRITMNQCVDYARHKQSQPPTQPLVQGEDDEERELPLPDTAPSPEEHLENSELGRELAAALDEVSDEHRRIVLLPLYSFMLDATMYIPRPSGSQQRLQRRLRRSLHSCLPRNRPDRLRRSTYRACA